MRIVWLSLAVVALPSLWLTAQETIYQDELLSEHYVRFRVLQCQEIDTYDVEFGSIEIAPNKVGAEKPLSMVFWSRPAPREVRRLLREKGYIKPPEPATGDPNSGSDISFFDRILQRTAEAVAWVWHRIWLVLGLIGLPAVLGFLYKKVYLERRVRMAVIGKAGVGKTALVLRMRNPGLPREKILNIDPNRVLIRRDIHRPVDYGGKFRVLPRVLDTAGIKYGEALDALIRGVDVIVVVVSHSPEKDSRAVDRDYLLEQLEYLRLFVKGVLESRRVHKPKMILLYLAKFGLFSAESPKDSTSRTRVAEFLTMFKAHRELVEGTSKAHGVPFAVIVGDSVEGWGAVDLLPVMSETLYGK